MAGRHRSGILAVLGTLCLALALYGGYYVVIDVPNDEARSFADPEQRVRVRNDVRETNAQILGGFVGGSIFLLGVIATWRTLLTAREGQITERFTRAIEQLGNDDRVEIRLGGIYALERIARDSARDHGPVMEVLTAFVRERSPWNEAAAADADHRPTTDVQAALTVIGRRSRWHGHGEERRLDLDATDLRRADLSNAHLEGADLRGAHLKRAYLRGAHLERANLVAAHLEGADLHGAHLEEAHLDGAHLEGANLTFAEGLTHAQIDSAHTDDTTVLPAYLTSPTPAPEEPPPAADV